MDVLGLMNDLTAASIAYGGFGEKVTGERNLFIFDLGGGTFNVTFLTREEGVLKTTW